MRRSARMPTKAGALEWAASSKKSWRATAEIYAEPALFRALTRPLRCDGGAIRWALATIRWTVTTGGGRRLRLGGILGRKR